MLAATEPAPKPRARPDRATAKGPPMFAAWRRRALGGMLACAVLATPATATAEDAFPDPPGQLLTNPSFFTGLGGWGSWGGRLQWVDDTYCDVRGCFAQGH